MDGGDGRRGIAGLLALFAAIAVAAAWDLAIDVREGTKLPHVLVEGSIALVGVAGIVGLSVRFHRLSSEARSLADRADALAERVEDLASRLEASRREAEAFRREAGDLIAGLGVAIDRQLERWGLTNAEKEVALLLLKGLSQKEIAEVRGVGEATVRQQSRAVYRKAGLEGRAALAAFFLEDLLVPRGGSSAS